MLAAEALIAHGHDELALEALVSLATGGAASDIGSAVVEALEQSGTDDAVDALVFLLESAEEDVAVGSARALMRLGVDAGLELLLMPASRSPDPSSVEILDEIEDALPENLPDVLGPLLRSRSTWPRRVAGRLLPTADDDNRAVSLAIEFLHDDEAAVRLGAARVLTYDDSADGERALAQRLGDLLEDCECPWEDGPYEPLFGSVADAVYYALERREGLLKRAIDCSAAEGGRRDGSEPPAFA